MRAIEFGILKIVKDKLEIFKLTQVISCFLQNFFFDNAIIATYNCKHDDYPSPSVSQDYLECDDYLHFVKQLPIKSVSI